MRLTLPFTYTTTIRKSGKDNLSTTVATDSVTVEMPELGRNDVQTVASWKERTARVEIKEWNGDLYQWGYDGADGPGRELSVNETRGMQVGVLVGSINRIYGWPHWWSTEGKMLNKALKGYQTALKLPRGSELISSTFDRERDDARYMAEGIITIDQKVWHRIPGIALHARPSAGRGEVNAIIRATPYGATLTDQLYSVRGLQNPVDAVYFGLNQLADANLVQEEIRPSSSQLEVQDMSAVALDGKDVFLARLMTYAVRTNEYRVGEMSTPELRLWMGMREAVSTGYSSRGIQLPDTAASDLIEFCSLDPRNVKSDRLSKGCEILERYLALETVTNTTAPISRRPGMFD